MWADDFAGRRRALVAEKGAEGDRSVFLAEGPVGAAVSQMGGAAQGVDDAEVDAWAFAHGGRGAVLVVVPRADAVSFGPMVLNAAGRPETDWTGLKGLGNGVWVAEGAVSGALRLRAHEAGAWTERVVETTTDQQVDDAGIPLGSIRASLPPQASTEGDHDVAEQAAQIQPQEAQLVLGSAWAERGLTWQRADGGVRRVVAHAEQGRSGAWAVTAYSWSTDPGTLGKGDAFEADGDTWNLQAYTDLVTAASAEPQDLMVALRLQGNDAQEMSIVVLTPQDATTVEVNGETYEVESRLAMVPDGGWDFDPQFVAKDATGRVLGSTRLPVASSIDGLLVPR
jgi:hypothetical protein